MKLFYVFIGLFNLFNLSNCLINSQYNIKSYICNDLYLNITPIICYNNNLLINNILTNNIPINYYYINNIPINYIESIPVGHINTSKRENYLIYNIFTFCFNQMILIFVNIMIIYILKKLINIKNKQLIINQIIIKIDYNTDLDICSICYENYTYYSNIQKIIKCNHNYHEKCIKEWIITYDKKNCPLCRCNIFD